MKSTSYRFGGQIYRYHGFYITIWLIIFIVAAKFIEPSSSTEIPYGTYTAFVFIVFLEGIVYLWLHPWVKIVNDGILISRFDFVKRKIKWNNIKLFKKVRTVTRLSLIGLDPRYIHIVIKDGIFIDRDVIVLPFFKGYDEFASEIEKNLKFEDIITDKNYRGK